MSIENTIKTAHIHFEFAMYRVHVPDATKYNIKEMEEDPDKPSYINFVSLSNDKEQRNSLLVDVTERFNLVEIADWISSHEKN